MIGLILISGHLLSGEFLWARLARYWQAIALTRTRATGFSGSSPRALLVGASTTNSNITCHEGEHFRAKLVQFCRSDAGNGHQSGRIGGALLREPREGGAGGDGIKGEPEGLRPLGAPPPPSPAPRLAPTWPAP